MTTTRRAAVLGGNRIPFARQFGAYAEASNQDMLTAALEGLVARYGLAGERLGEVVGRRGHQAQPRLQPDPRGGARLEPRRRRPRPTTSPQACGTGLEAAILVANKIALGQIDSGIAGGVDSASDAPDRRAREAAPQAAAAQPRQDAGRHGQGGARLPARPTSASRCPANTEPRTGLSMGEHMADHRAAVGHHPRGPGRSSPLASHQQPRRRLRPRLLRRPPHALPRARPATRTCAPDSTAREARPRSSRSSARARARR